MSGVAAVDAECPDIVEDSRVGRSGKGSISSLSEANQRCENEQ